MLQRLSCWAK